MDKKFNFTKKDIDALPIPTKGKSCLTFSDSTEKGLKLYITPNGAKTFFIRKTINRKDEKIIIGPYPDLTISQARDKARVLKGNIANGSNPAEEKRKLNKDMTINEFFDYYIQKHSLVNKRPNSIKAEKSLYNNYIKNFIGFKKMTVVTKNDIERLLRYLLNANMKTTYNRVISLLSGMYNRAIEWGYPEANPVKDIKKVKEKSRDRFIQPDELPRFFDELNKEPNQVFRNYILLSLYTGQRRSNVLAMKWSQIDLKLGIWFIPITKNGESMDCPLTLKAIELLKEIKKTSSSDWVFPSETSASGHYEEPKRAWHNLLKRSGIENLRLHDLRRTLGSYQAINGSSLQIIGKSLGHKSMQSTQVYARLMNDPIRNSTNSAIDKMLEYAGENNE